jgi:pilus assembly protein CpaF
MARLSDRVKAAKEQTPSTSASGAGTGPRIGSSDPYYDYKMRARTALYERLGANTLEETLDEGHLTRVIREELERIIREDGAPLAPEEVALIAADINTDILGYGPIEPFLNDPEVTEVMVNGLDPIYVERVGRLHRTKARFATEEHLRRVIDRIVARIGRRVDEASPMVDARLPDGSRVNAIIPPLAVDGATLTIRKFSRDPYLTDDLLEFGTMTPEIAELLRACVDARLNILITGGTGTGKTTFLNVLSSYIEDGHRIVTIEDAVELQMHQEHVVRLEARPPNIEGRGEVTIRDLVRNSLRMRPDRIIVGEVRGAEALDMLQAMNTGHEGSMSTLHSNTPRDGLNRLETMVMMAGIELPVGAIREYIASALSLVVHLGRFRDGSRKVTHITEVVGREGDLITLQDIFTFQHMGGLDEHGKMRGAVRPTGIRPGFADHMADMGLALPPELFDNHTGTDRGSRR